MRSRKRSWLQHWLRVGPKPEKLSNHGIAPLLILWGHRSHIVTQVTQVAHLSNFNLLEFCTEKLDGICAKYKNRLSPWICPNNVYPVLSLFQPPVMPSPVISCASVTRLAISVSAKMALTFLKTDRHATEVSPFLTEILASEIMIIRHTISQDFSWF